MFASINDQMKYQFFLHRILYNFACSIVITVFEQLTIQSPIKARLFAGKKKTKQNKLVTRDLTTEHSGIGHVMVSSTNGVLLETSW